MSYLIPLLILGGLAIAVGVFANAVKDKDITLPEGVEFQNDYDDAIRTSTAFEHHPGNIHYNSYAERNQ